MPSSGEAITSEALARAYADALADYVASGSEAALTLAYELGRAAAGGGVGILELAVMHHDALAELPPQAVADRPPLAMAAQFLAEALSPFEMTLRSYRANARLLGLGETLAQENAEIDRARQQLRTILDATTAVIYLKDAEGRYLFVNRQFGEVFHLRREEVIGKLDADVLPAEAATMLHANDLRVLEARAPGELEEVLAAGDGAHTYLSLKFPLLDAEGAPYGMCCVATDITERKRADEALQRAREAAERERQLQETVRARDQFLAITSHELKTPLTSLRLQVSTLRRIAGGAEGSFSGERVQAKCDMLVRQVDRLTILINDLIEVGRITSGQLSLSRGQVDLADVVRLVVARSQEAIAQSGSAVALHTAPAPGSWDRLLLETVVSHLLSNALKFGEGRPIDIEVRTVPEPVRAVVSVRDRGIGISAEDQRRIFDRFERAVSERNFGGFGIGLWVARQAVEAHGGTIAVQSDAGGSIFTVELPVHPAAAAP
jgi:PAS domain S-box-containing protein